MAKEIAVARARLFPSTYRRLRLASAKAGKTIAEIVAEMEKRSRQRTSSMS